MDYTEWSDGRLQGRLTEVETATEVHTEGQRAAQIRREVAHLRFELNL